MKTIPRNSIFYILTTLLGLLFICSAYLKFITIDMFELNLVETGFVGWSLAPWLARLIVGFELFLGILVMLNFRLKRFTLPVAFGLLSFFTLYLFYVLFTKGNQENCNCFGSYVVLNPLESVLKNIFLFILAFLIFRYHNGLEWGHPALMAIGICAVTFAIPLTVDPVLFSDSRPTIQNSEFREFNSNLLYSGSSFIRPTREIRKGKYIVVFLSLKCPYCKLSAYKLHLIKKKNPEIPVYFILTGKVGNLPGFLAETKAYDIPHTFLLKSDFITLVGREVPVILYLEEGVAVKKIDYTRINQQDIEKWLGITR
ncbi:MAG: MauE/DoxX family redox-associated membrane protein [Bacteroidota bacterium]